MGTIDPCIDETINYWAKRVGKKLSRVEAQQAVVNTVGFFQVLAEWNQKEVNGLDAPLPRPNGKSKSKDLLSDQANQKERRKKWNSNL
jgi:hypothetical protein